MNEDGIDADGHRPDELGRKPAKTLYAPGNIREDGSYRVGKGRPPQHSRFRADDGRKRGRRPKGQANFETDLLREAGRRITLRENGKDRRVTKQHATIIRTFDIALAKADLRASGLLFHHLSRAQTQQAANAHHLPVEDDEELNAWLLERLAVLESTEVPELPIGPNTGRR